MIQWEKQEDGSMTCPAHAAIIYDRGRVTLPPRRGGSREVRYYRGRSGNLNLHVVLVFGRRYYPCRSFAEAKREANRLAGFR